MLSRYGTLYTFILIFVSPSVLSQPLWQTLNEAVVQAHIIPQHEIFEKTTHALEESAQKFCRDINLDTLANIREAYFSVNDAWMQLQHFHHGPIHKERRIYRIQLFPDKRNAVGKHLNKLLKSADRTRLTSENFVRLSTALQGLSALEHLLFSEDYPLNSFRDADTEQNFQCALVVAISQNLNVIAQRALREWQQDIPLYEQFFNVKKYPIAQDDADPELRARTEVTAIIFYSYHTQISHIINSKLKMPLGKSIEKSRPHWREMRYSQRSLENIKINLTALETLYDLSYAPYIQLKKDGDGTHQKIKRAYRNIQKHIDSFQMPLGQAVKDPTGRGQVEALINKLEGLYRETMTLMAKTLAVPLRFNGIDGD